MSLTHSLRPWPAPTLKYSSSLSPALTLCVQKLPIVSTFVETLPQVCGAPALLLLLALPAAAQPGPTLHWYEAAISDRLRNATNAKRPMATPQHDAIFSGGMAGVHSLIALLLALEARFFVLGSQSNWSRLINELRLAFAEPAARRTWCGGRQLPSAGAGDSAAAASTHARQHHSVGCTEVVDVDTWAGKPEFSAMV